MSVTAIIPHYWDSRVKDLPDIVDALRCGAWAPSQIIIWNNTSVNHWIDGAHTINAGANWGIAARLAAAYLATSEYVFFQDNDLTVQSKTLANLMKYAPPHGQSVELQGRIFGTFDAPYSSSQYITGMDSIVHVGLSRFSLMRRSTAMHLATVIPPNVTDDDLWVSRHAEIRVVPFGEDEGFVNIPETEGLSLGNPGAHVRRRDALVQELWRDIWQAQSA